MIADRDALTKDMNANQHGNEANPRKEIWNEGHEAEQVHNQNGP